MAKKTFCDGCDHEIEFDGNGVTKNGARVNLSIKASCHTIDETELGQFAQSGLDLCGNCIDHMKRTMDPKTWARAAPR